MDFWVLPCHTIDRLKVFLTKKLPKRSAQVRNCLRTLSFCGIILVDTSLLLRYSPRSSFLHRRLCFSVRLVSPQNSSRKTCGLILVYTSENSSTHSNRRRYLRLHLNRSNFFVSPQNSPRKTCGLICKFLHNRWRYLRFLHLAVFICSVGQKNEDFF